MADIIFLALLTVFIVLRVRHMLGKKEGTESELLEKLRRFADKSKQNFQATPSKSTNRVIDVEFVEEKDSYFPNLPENIKKVFSQIHEAQPQFTVEKFVSGASKAFELIIEAFSKNDKESLKSLLSEKLYAQFSREIDLRTQKGEIHHITLVSLDSKEIISAKIQATDAYITLKFISEQIYIVRNQEGNVVSGDPSKVEIITDKWTFMRSLTSKAPNWILESAEVA